MRLKTDSTPRSLFLFYLLVSYVLIQFIWWSYLLFDLNTKVYANTNELKARWLMIAGEGLVFLVLMAVGIIRIRINLKREAALANQQKNFLLSVSHELKSPIASIKLIFETIQKRDLEKNKLQEIASNGNKDAERLNTLVENILLSTLFDTNNYKINKEQTDFSAYLASEINKLKQTFGNHHNFLTEIENNISLPIDPFNFHSILSNLIENAVKYSPHNSTIKILLSKKGQTVILSVNDEGPGIIDEEKEKIFYKFYRIGNEETRNTKGTGLGLYIVKQLVEKHSGKIILKNNVPRGSIFEINLKKTEE
jgi:two-component system phosphate regulon sensor histidine kinase PhoR